MNQREKLIAGIVGVVVVLGGGYAVIAKPYWIDKRADLKLQIEKAQKQQAIDNALIKSVPSLTAAWNDLRDKGLVDDVAQSGAQLQDSILALSIRNRVSLESLHPTRVAPIAHSDFQEYKLSFTGSGSSMGVWPFVYALEDSKLPLRIDSVQIRSRKDGIDDLNVELNITTLVHTPPPPPKSTTKPATRGASARGASTRGAVAVETRPAGPSLDELEAQLKARRERELNGDLSNSTQPAAAPAPVVSLENSTQPSTQPSPTGGVR